MSLFKKFSLLPADYARSKGDARKFWTMFLVLLLGLLIFNDELRYRLRSLLEYPIHYKEYKHFSIRIPSGYQMHGIDVSRWQSKVDWKRVKRMQVGKVRVSFAFIKATEGTWMRDPQFERNWRGAKEAGILRGAYHFFLPNVSVKDQMLQFSRAVKLKSGDLPPVLDVEETRGMSKGQIQQYTKEFLDLLEKNYKIKPILYTNKDFYKNYFSDVAAFKGYRFWIAHYHVSDFDMPGEEDWHFWQHSDRGNINGINELVDFNVFNGDSLELRGLCLP